MLRRCLVFFLIVLSVTIVSADFQVASAMYDAPEVMILSDGTVDPPTAAISKSENTYTLTENVTARVVIQKNNVTYDGAGYAILDGGIRIESNDTIVKNTVFENCGPAILVAGGSHNTIENNSFYHVIVGISITGDYNTVKANNIYSGLYTLIYVNGNYNTITQNYAYGIEIFSDASNNVITENTLDYIADLGENNTCLNNTLDAFGTSPSPTPTIPELSTIILSTFILIIFGAAVIKLKRPVAKTN